MVKLQVLVDPNPVTVNDEFTVAIGPEQLTAGGPTHAEFVIALDASPSMSWLAMGEQAGGPTRWDLAREGVGALLRAIDADATVQVVLFADDAERLDSGPAADLRRRLDQVLPVTQPPGYRGTNIEAGLRESYACLRTSTATSRTVLFLSDGEPTMGRTRPEDLEAIAAAATRADIYTRPIGFGVGVNIDLLKMIASSGDPDHVRSAASTVGTVTALMARLGAASQDTVASGGELEITVSPHFEVLGVYQVTPARRRIKHAFRPQRDAPTIVTVSIGAVGAGENRPVFALRLQAPDRTSRDPLILLRCAGRMRMKGSEIALDERRVTVELSNASSRSLRGDTLDIINGIDLEESVAEEIRAAPPEEHVRIYRDAQRRARNAGLGDLAQIFADSLRQLGEGEDARDVYSGTRSTSSKGVTQANRLLLDRPHVEPAQRVPRQRPQDDEDDEEYGYGGTHAPTRAREAPL